VFLGFDWASDHHDVVGGDPHGRIVADFRFAEPAAGWPAFRQKLHCYAEPAVAIEISGGAVVEHLPEAGGAVYPKAAKRYRERKAPTGAKTERSDAWSLADARRQNGDAWRGLPTSRRVGPCDLCSFPILTYVTTCKTALQVTGSGAWGSGSRRNSAAGAPAAIFGVSGSVGARNPWL
jgi:hypothetical protein